MNVQCLRRTNRQGYKAGAMKEVRHSGLLLFVWLLGAEQARLSSHLLSLPSPVPATPGTCLTPFRAQPALCLIQYPLFLCRAWSC